MSGIRITTSVARDIPDAWFQAVDAVQKEGRINIIEHGSYEGQRRWELDYYQAKILHPYNDNVGEMLPKMPPHLAHIPQPCTEEYIVGYFDSKTRKYIPGYLEYVMGETHPKENEQYTYAQRIHPQMEEIIRRYKKHGFGSNQECIAVAKPEDINLPDPPCLRQIDTRIFKGENLLHFFVYYRSWDLWNGFPANLAAIALMMKYMANEIGVEPGSMIVSSKGLHLYDHVWDISKLTTGA
jgi:thymidylate synthase